MSETENLKKPKKSNKKAEKILEETIHPIVLFYGISFSLFILYYAFVLNRIPFLLTFMLLSIAGFMSYYNFYGRKIVITQNKLYIYRLGKKIISLSYAKDFLHIKYEKTKIGRLLNYGSILLVTQDNMYYKIHFLNNPEKIFYTAIQEYENVMSIVNPDYEKKYVTEQSSDGKSKRINSSDDFEKIDD